MGYYIDLEKISLDDYSTRLQSAYLPPGRMLLKDKTAARFALLKSQGIRNLAELVQHFKQKNGQESIALQTLLGVDYLTILRREVKSLHPKPVKLADFDRVSREVVVKLAHAGIQNTLQLYPYVAKHTNRQRLSATLDIDMAHILELTKLTDLVRIKWVGAGFAGMLYALGIDTAEKASRTDAEQLYEAIRTYNMVKNVFKGHIGLNDIQIFVQAAGDIPFDIEF